MIKLTKAVAEGLLRRELDVGPSRITKPARMNGDPKYPYFEAQLGNLTTTVRLNTEAAQPLIELSLSFRDGYGSITRFFYADNDYENYLQPCEHMNAAEQMITLLEVLEADPDKTADALASELVRKTKYLRGLV